MENQLLLSNLANMLPLMLNYLTAQKNIDIWSSVILQEETITELLSKPVKVQFLIGYLQEK